MNPKSGREEGKNKTERGVKKQMDRERHGQEIKEVSRFLNYFDKFYHYN